MDLTREMLYSAEATPPAKLITLLSSRLLPKQTSASRQLSSIPSLQAIITRADDEYAFSLHPLHRWH
jgi:hypothetical protein